MLPQAELGLGVGVGETGGDGAGESCQRAHCALPQGSNTAQDEASAEPGAVASWATGFPTCSAGVRPAMPSERSDRSEDVVAFPGSEQNFDVLGCT